jgi:hypothetical protein
VQVYGLLTSRFVDTAFLWESQQSCGFRVRSERRTAVQRALLKVLAGGLPWMIMISILSDIYQGFNKNLFPRRNKSERFHRMLKCGATECLLLLLHLLQIDEGDGGLGWLLGALHQD